MTNYSNESLAAQFAMDSLPGARRSKGALYSQKELQRAVRILTADGYTMHDHRHGNESNPYLMLVNPLPSADGRLDVVHIFLHAGNRDTRWSGGMMAFGKAHPGTGFEKIDYESNTTLWDFLNGREPGLGDRIKNFFSKPAEGKPLSLHKTGTLNHG